MNNPELNAMLKAARLPEGAAEIWENIPREVLAEIRRDSRPGRDLPLRRRGLSWGLALATAAVLLAFTLGYWRGHATGPDVLQDAKFVRETLTLFPHRVRAIVKDDRGLNLVLSETDDVPASPPLYVRICDGRQCASFVTFSGQEIQIAGRKVTVLADPRGGIILEGRNFIWSSTRPELAENDLKIQAKLVNAIRL